MLVIRARPKTLNEFFSGKMTPCRKISTLCSESFHDDTDSSFVFKFHGNRVPGSG